VEKPARRDPVGPFANETHSAIPRSHAEINLAQPPLRLTGSFVMIDFILNLLYEQSLCTYLSAMPKPDTQK
jgi:hypothetical protein